MNTRRFLVHLPAAVFAALLQLRSNLSVAQEPEARLHVRQDMTAVYLAFKELQPFLARREEFLAEHNEKRILELVFTLAGKFQHVQLTDQKYMSEPGFNTTLEVLNEMLIDARNRFQEGKKSYALWRLKTSASYCISCHTRHSVPMDFSDVESSIKGMNILEQSEFYLATRQFDKASQGFLATVYDPAAGYHRMEALRRWLIIQTRVHPDPDGALSELLRLRGKVKLSAFEDEEVLAWVESLRRWKGESKADIPPLVKAENLVRQSFNMSEALSGKIGAVELLRATSILHALLERSDFKSPQDRGRALYLLGLSYSELPLFFIDELPDSFLELCIRENPGSDDAKKAFRLYRDLVTLGYSGSGGTRLPDDVLLQFKELHDLAYGIPSVRGRV